jgi:hypothetical protein
MKHFYTSLLFSICLFTFQLSHSQNAVISSLNCSTATNNGILKQGVVCSGVNSVVPYTGGNGGSYPAQSINSTGVTGLIAKLAAGNVAASNLNLLGTSTITYIISGTPTSSGTASFLLNIGGKTCTLNRIVNLPDGVITALNCASSTNSGTLTSGSSASGVTSVVPYTGGNGGVYPAQSVPSTGVSGLVANLAAGTFLNGAGTLTFTITGRPTSAGTATFPLNIGGKTCALTRTINLPVGTITALNCESAPILEFFLRLLQSQVPYYHRALVLRVLCPIPAGMVALMPPKVLHLLV